MVLIMKYITLIILSTLFLTGCKNEYKYAFYLIKMESYENKAGDLYVKFNPEATPLKRKFGAVIKNGPPFKFDACITKDENDIFKLKKINIYNDADGKNVPIDAIVDIDVSWTDMGKISCAYDIVSFEEVVDEEKVYCIDVIYELNGRISEEKSCWNFKHEVGESVMTKEDILNQ